MARHWWFKQLMKGTLRVVNPAIASEMRHSQGVRADFLQEDASTASWFIVLSNVTFNPKFQCAD